MKKNRFVYFSIVFILYVFSNINLYSISAKNGDLQYGFSSTLLPLILFDPIKRSYYVAVSEQIANNAYYTYGLSCTNEKNGKFVPLLVARALVDNILMDSPIYGVGFSNLALIRINGVQGAKYVPAVVVNDGNKPVSPNIYVLMKSRWIGYDKNIILSTPTLTDGNGDPAKILGIQTMQNGMCAFVCNLGKNFGEVGCAGLLYGYVPTETIQQTGSAYIVTSSMQQKFKTTFDETINAFKIDDSDTINFDTTQTPCIFGDPDLNAVYVGISGSAENGICAVTNYNNPIVSTDAIDANSIIASNVQDQKVYIKNISTLHTSTGLFYLVVQAGDDTSSLNNIYAIPLVNDVRQAMFGNLADTTTYPEHVFNSDLAKTYAGTVFSTPADTLGSLYANTDLSAMVGGGSLEFNGETFKITSIQSQRDCIFVQATYTGSGISGAYGGLFYSQALFDSTGKISSWTPWQRKTFLVNSACESYEPNNGQYLCFDSSQQSVLETSWNNNYGQFAFLNNTSNLPDGGIQGIVDIPCQHPSIKANSNGFRSSYAFLLGYKTVILMQTSKNSSLTPCGGAILNASSGNLNNFDSSLFYGTLIMSGGALDCDDNALVYGEIAYNSSDCWPIVCGSSGIFVLMNQDGTGCGANKLGADFGTFQSSFSWNKLSSLSNVKKIIPQERWIFVLTNDSLYKIEATANNLSKKENCEIIKIVSVNNFSGKVNAFFSDFLVSANSCLLATSAGLFKNANDSMFKSISDGINYSWVNVNLPETNFPPIYLYPISRSGYQNDWANDKMAQANNDIAAGNIYVLVGSIGTHEIYLHRLVSYDSSVSGTEDDSIENLLNYFIENVPSYYARFPSGQFSIVGDGASWYTHDVKENPIFFKGAISLLPSYLKAGMPFAINQMANVAISQNYGSFLGPVTYISGYGIWVLPHSAGVLTLS